VGHRDGRTEYTVEAGEILAGLRMKMVRRGKRKEIFMG
jgi:hypothetical protein